MTRAELEQVREVVLFAYGESQRVAGMTAKVDEALGILNSELAKPEAREWRLTWQGGKSSPVTDKEVIENYLADALATEVGRQKCPRIESRTPAGPWVTTE